MEFVSYEADNKWDLKLRQYQGKKLLLTPHIAGNTFESIRTTSKVVVSKLAAIYLDNLLN